MRVPVLAVPVLPEGVHQHHLPAVPHDEAAQPHGGEAAEQPDSVYCRPRSGQIGRPVSGSTGVLSGQGALPFQQGGL